ncbi:TlpA disulfide reductase family protein [Sphingobacterium sp. UT-1RO-CII-1]|uniref:TlpA family protein disulfide reductase n=1 Tax=Sphingobacterium sp. UT-1RO-CII-1 TaxID=2995225 RepID=UPI00227ACD05|nr:TlpA disulfide reductase family protein [Sphingobacterium sp. UT-1RO-CII-1]MCY4778912.1 TlpA disulfide reductase family protein [Sphingobacterium sp. UT-1RO-CII-1]
MNYYKYIVLVIYLLSEMQCIGFTQNEAKIIVSTDLNEKEKTMTVEFWDELLCIYTLAVSPNTKTLNIKSDSGKYEFNIPVNETTYFRFGWQKDENGVLISSHIPSVWKASTGDEVAIYIDSAQNFTFTGEGSKKYEAWHEIMLVDRKSQSGWWALRAKEFNRKIFSEAFMMYEDKFFYVNTKKKEVLSLFKAELSETDYQFLELEIMAKDYFDLFQDLIGSIVNRPQSYFIDKPDSNLKDSVLMEIFHKRERDLEFSDKQKWSSLYYSLYAVSRFRGIAKLNDQAIPDMVPTVYKGKLMQKILSNYYLLYGDLLSTEEIDEARLEVKHLITVPNYLSELSNSILKDKEEKAYLHIKLIDQNDEEFTLADFKGKIVFIDFWFTGCGGCSGYYRTVLKPVEQQVDKDQVVFVSVSADSDRDRWKASVKSGRYTSEHGINVQSQDGIHSPIIKAFGVVSYPQPVLLDRDGNIFSTSSKDLKMDGVEGLLKNIEKALNVSN